MRIYSYFDFNSAFMFLTVMYVTYLFIYLFLLCLQMYGSYLNLLHDSRVSQSSDLKPSWPRNTMT